MLKFKGCAHARHGEFVRAQFEKGIALLFPRKLLLNNGVNESVDSRRGTNFESAGMLNYFSRSGVKFPDTPQGVR